MGGMGRGNNGVTGGGRGNGVTGGGWDPPKHTGGWEGTPQTGLSSLGGIGVPPAPPDLPSMGVVGDFGVSPSPDLSPPCAEPCPEIPVVAPAPDQPRAPRGIRGALGVPKKGRGFPINPPWAPLRWNFISVSPWMEMSHPEPSGESPKIWDTPTLGSPQSWGPPNYWGVPPPCPPARRPPGHRQE